MTDLKCGVCDVELTFEIQCPHVAFGWQQAEPVLLSAVHFFDRYTEPVGAVLDDLARIWGRIEHTWLYPEVGEGEKDLDQFARATRRFLFLWAHIIQHALPPVGFDFTSWESLKRQLPLSGPSWRSLLDSSYEAPRFAFVDEVLDFTQNGGWSHEDLASTLGEVAASRIADAISIGIPGVRVESDEGFRPNWGDEFALPSWGRWGFHLCTNEDYAAAARRLLIAGITTMTHAVDEAYKFWRSEDSPHDRAEFPAFPWIEAGLAAIQAHSDWSTRVHSRSLTSILGSLEQLTQDPKSAGDLRV